MNENKNDSKLQKTELLYHIFMIFHAFSKVFFKKISFFCPKCPIWAIFPPSSLAFCLALCLVNPFRFSPAFWRDFGANATKHSDYVRKHLRQNAQKGRGNGRNLRHTTLALRTENGSEPQQLHGVFLTDLLPDPFSESLSDGFLRLE